MRTLMFLVALSLLASGLAAQRDSGCAAPDSAPIIAWHSRWDTADVSSGVRDTNTSGIITIPVDPNSPGYRTVDRDAIYGHYRLVAVLVGKRDTDIRYDGQLRLSPPTRETLAHNEANKYFRTDRAVSGALIGSELVRAISDTPQDSVPLEGYFDVAGYLSFSDRLGVEDGGAFWVERWDTRHLQGWWNPSGATIPPPLGYFCASRIQ
jgi:hypothetical protein